MNPYRRAGEHADVMKSFQLPWQMRIKHFRMAILFGVAGIVIGIMTCNIGEVMTGESFIHTNNTETRWSVDPMQRIDDLSYELAATQAQLDLANAQLRLMRDDTRLDQMVASMLANRLEEAQAKTDLQIEKAQLRAQIAVLESNKRIVGSSAHYDPAPTPVIVDSEVVRYNSAPLSLSRLTAIGIPH